MALKNQKGSVMIEAVMSCIVLVMFLFIFIESYHLIINSMYTKKIAREAAREASISRKEVAASRRQHNPDEPADKWFVLAVALNLYRSIEGRN